MTQYKDIAQAEAEAYYDQEGSFPGSRGWQSWQRALKAREAFEAAHPEVVAESKRLSEAARVARLSGIDIYGL